MDTTPAKIGRSMKKCEMRMGLAGSVGQRLTGGASAEAVDCCGATFTPGRTRIRPLTTTRSFGVRPVATTRSPSMTGPSVTYLARATF